MQVRAEAPSRSQRGYNLVEVLVAVAVTGVVIISVMTLFFLGQKNVYSGKQMTAANAVATRVLEDFSMMAAYDVISNFGLTDSTTRSTNVVAGTSYPLSVLRASDGTINSTTDPGGYMARWAALVPATTFNSGRLSIIITPASPVDSTKPITTAQVLRVRGVVEWRENRRRRTVVFDSSKAQRP